MEALAAKKRVLILGGGFAGAYTALHLELSKPLEGFIQISSAPLRNALQHLNQ